MTATTTDYRISDLDGTELFNFNSATMGVGTSNEPSLENISSRKIFESQDYRSAGLTSQFYVGKTPSSFVIRGLLVDDASNENQWLLKYIVNEMHVVKLWAGSQWFVYASGQECSFSRVDAETGIYRYQAAFNCFDPYEYYANTGGGASTAYQVSPLAVALSSSNIDIDLSGSGTGKSKTFVEPFFLLQGGSTTSVSTSQNVTFTDQDGRKATFTPPVTWASGVDYIICPHYFRETLEGYQPQTLACYRIPDGSITTSGSPLVASAWPLDLNCYDNTKFTHASSDLVRTFATLSVADTSATNIKPRWMHPYPRANRGAAGGASAGQNRIVVASTGTIGDGTIHAIYLHRRPL